MLIYFRYFKHAFNDLNYLLKFVIFFDFIWWKYVCGVMMYWCVTYLIMTWKLLIHMRTEFGLLCFDILLCLALLYSVVTSLHHRCWSRIHLRYRRFVGKSWFLDCQGEWVERGPCNSFHLLYMLNNYVLLLFHWRNSLWKAKISAELRYSLLISFFLPLTLIFHLFSKVKFYIGGNWFLKENGKVRLWQ